MVLPRGALVNTLHKDVVKLLSHSDLSMLQLCKGVNHHGVVEILLYGTFKESKVIGRELRNTVIKCLCYLRVRSNFFLEYILDILLALLHVDTQLLKVPGHQLLV